MAPGVGQVRRLEGRWGGFLPGSSHHTPAGRRDAIELRLALPGLKARDKSYVIHPERVSFGKPAVTTDGTNVHIDLVQGRLRGGDRLYTFDGQFVSAEQVQGTFRDLEAGTSSPLTLSRQPDAPPRQPSARSKSSLAGVSDSSYSGINILAQDEYNYGYNFTAGFGVLTHFDPSGGAVPVSAWSMPQDGSSGALEGDYSGQICTGYLTFERVS